MRALHEIFFKSAGTMYSDLVELEYGHSHEAIERAGRDSLSKVERFAGHDLGVYKGYRVRFVDSQWEYSKQPER